MMISGGECLGDSLVMTECVTRESGQCEAETRPGSAGVSQPDLAQHRGLHSVLHTTQHQDISNNKNNLNQVHNIAVSPSYDDEDEFWFPTKILNILWTRQNNTMTCYGNSRLFQFLQKYFREAADVFTLFQRHSAPTRLQQICPVL